MTDARAIHEIAKPFLKWAGGKSRLLPTLLPMFPKKFGRYFEPFLGGGAVFFALRPQDAMLSDRDFEVKNVYSCVRDDLDKLLVELREHAERHSREHYYEVRAQPRRSLPFVSRAARFIYLNRTCFNGLYRVNKAGEFNVPIGDYKNPTICDEETLRAASKALLASTLWRGLYEHEHHEATGLWVMDFEFAAEEAIGGDLVYFDPPYVPLTPTANFTAYSPGGFGEADHRRLAALFNELTERGVYCVASNSDTPLVRELYAGHRIMPVQVRRSISCKGAKREAVGEVIIRGRGDW